jgi:hypothetical protein
MVSSPSVPVPVPAALVQGRSKHVGCFKARLQADANLVDRDCVLICSGEAPLDAKCSARGEAIAKRRRCSGSESKRNAYTATACQVWGLHLHAPMQETCSKKRMVWNMYCTVLCCTW